ncbi:MAG: carbohydrate kinase [Actinobacteria bacterium]|nr:MAG: carbohydrate kinase [Actinomycetota bacterium]
MIVGQLTRDLVLVVDEMPEESGSIPVRLRRELLGGKAANQAVALAQLGFSVGLVAVTGDDRIGDDLLAQAARDGVDVSTVIRRPGARTALIVEVLRSGGSWRYFEDISGPVLLTEEDVTAAATQLAHAPAVVIQLQQPTVAALRAAHLATGLVVLDGAPDDERLRDALFAEADVIRADARETAHLFGSDVLADPERARSAARTLLALGRPRLVALALDPLGNLFVWPDGDLLVPHPRAPVVDTTGAGDAFTAALVAGLLHGDEPRQVARFAVAAASATVCHPGGRADLSPERLTRHLALVDEALGIPVDGESQSARDVPSWLAG